MDKLSESWLSLGIAFATETNEIADPEVTLIKTLSILQQERKFLGLILAWIEEYGDLIHIERIKALAKNLHPIEIAWLGGIALHATKFDRRWDVIVHFARKNRQTYKRRFQTSELDMMAAERKGFDKKFKTFGLTIPIFEISKKSKILNRSHTLNKHTWLKLRALFGANWRADIAWMMLKNTSQTPYQIAKTLACNIETAYRNWYSLKEANVVGLLKVT